MEPTTNHPYRLVKEKEEYLVLHYVEKRYRFLWWTYWRRVSKKYMFRESAKQHLESLCPYCLLNYEQQNFRENNIL